MEYSQLVKAVGKLDFIHNDKRAAVALKASYSILVATLPAQEIRPFANMLPAPLNYQELQEHQEKAVNKTPEEQLQQLASQLDVQENQAEELVRNVFALTRRHLAEQQHNQWLKRIEDDWSNFVKKFD